MQKVLRSCLLFLSFLSLCLFAEPSMAKQVVPIPVGVVLDLKSSLGTMAETCIQIGLSDFYNHNAHYATRLTLQIRDSENDVVAAGSAALDLIKNKRVHAVLGPQSSGEARFVAELGSKAQIPIISFSATSPSLSPTQNHFFIRTTQSDLSQVKAISAIAQAYGWHQITLIYENTEYGNGLIPYLTAALGEINIQVLNQSVIDPRSEEAEILKKLNYLKDRQRNIFLVHMTTDLGSRFFKLAYKEGMMREGYAWIVTQGLSAMIDPMSPKVTGYMQGVLGVRPIMQKTVGLVDFKRRWKALGKANNKTSVLTLVGLRAYDTVQALAIAVEKACTVNSTFKTSNAANKSRVGTGPKLLNTILNTKFRGLSGDFNLIDGQLRPSIFEVFNVVGKTERTIGYWCPERGLFRDLDEAVDPITKGKLKQPIWPGDTTEQPTILLRIGVPVREGFTEFVKVDMQFPNGTARCSGFAIDVFSEIVKVLPVAVRYDYFPLTKKNGRTAGNYDELLCRIKEEKLDVIVGDFTIVANRTKCVDYALPYLESSVFMVVNKQSANTMWILFKPFHWSLWVLIVSIFVSVTYLICKLECTRIRKNGGNEQQVLHMLCFPSTFFTHSERLVSKQSRWLSLICSEERVLEPSVKDVKEIIRKGYLVGYQRDSWVKGLLIEQLGLKESQLKAYDTPEEYHKALSLERVAAIFDETPYLAIFLSTYSSSPYAMTGVHFQTYGFGFAFPQKSNLVSYFSPAIVNVTQDVRYFQDILKKFSLSGTPAQFPHQSNARSLMPHDFCGFYLVIFSIWSLALGSLLWDRFKSWCVPGNHSSLQPPPREGATLGTPREDHLILGPHHNDTCHYAYHSDYY